MESTWLDFRSCVDDSLPADGHRRLVGLAPLWHRRRPAAPHLVRVSASAQLSLDAGLLRPPSNGQRLHRYLGVVGSNPRYDCFVLEAGAFGWSSSAAVFRMDYVCISLEWNDLAPQSLARLRHEPVPEDEELGGRWEAESESCWSSGTLGNRVAGALRDNP